MSESASQSARQSVRVFDESGGTRGNGDNDHFVGDRDRNHHHHHHYHDADDGDDNDANNNKNKSNNNNSNYVITAVPACIESMAASSLGA